MLRVELDVFTTEDYPQSADVPPNSWYLSSHTLYYRDRGFEWHRAINSSRAIISAFREGEKPTLSDDDLRYLAKSLGVQQRHLSEPDVPF